MHQKKSQKEHTLILSSVQVHLIKLFIELELKLDLKFSGVFRGGAEVLLRAKLALADGVTMQLTVRSTDQDVAEIVSSAIG